MYIEQTFLLLLLPSQLRGAFLVHLFKFEIWIEKSRTMTSNVAPLPHSEPMCPPQAWLTLKLFNNLRETCQSKTPPRQILSGGVPPLPTGLGLNNPPTPYCEPTSGSEQNVSFKMDFSWWESLLRFLCDWFQVYDFVCGCPIVLKVCLHVMILHLSPQAILPRIEFLFSKNK